MLSNQGREFSRLIHETQVDPLCCHPSIFKQNVLLDFFKIIFLSVVRVIFKSIKSTGLYKNNSQIIYLKSELGKELISTRSNNNYG